MAGSRTNQPTRKTVPVQPETHYARSGDVSIAYQVDALSRSNPATRVTNRPHYRRA